MFGLFRKKDKPRKRPVRVPVSIDAVYIDCTDAETGALTFLPLVDVSKTGLKFVKEKKDQVIKKGRKYNLRIHLEGGILLPKVVGEVIWIREIPDTGYMEGGMKFLEISKVDLNRLIEFVEAKKAVMD
ncbi:MAG: PilZ domain-containing protein [Candidatus Eremiobacteraeota bacterium]|nr:PilZ domain-containing protein [Candidatus Eremiobacteraeota bacterium]